MEEYRAGMEQPETLPEKKNGMGRGVLMGCLGTLLIGALSVGGACAVTGYRVVFAPKGAAVVQESAMINKETVTKINELSGYIDAYFYEDTDEEDLQNGMYAGLLAGLGDKYSDYYTAEEYRQTRVSMTGKYYGIGAGLRQDTDTMVVSVSKIYEGTPSDEAGMLAEDIILSVDGTEADSMDVTDLVMLIRGEEGTTVHIEAYRPSTDEYLSFDVKRANVTLPSVSSELLQNGTGYIRIESFEEDTAKQFETELAKLEGSGIRSLIVDLRYNGGGLVDSVVDILDDILPEGLLVYVEDKYGNRQEYNSDGDTYIEYPLAVLINGDSASASEIFAGAVKDYEYGTLIGTKTFGKGIVQSVIPLDDGDAIKLTTAKYFTPKGNYIHGVGIEPDIELEYEYLDPDGESYEIQYDNQILKAIEVLSENR